jgi:SPP1 family predicted phage head-tail adaptor
MANPGKMDRRVLIQKRTLTKDAAGGMVETWADHAHTWGEKVEESGKESELADAERGDNQTKWRVRYKSFFIGVTATSGYRIKYKTEVFDITHAKEEGRKNTHLLTTITTEGIQ